MAWQDRITVDPQVLVGKPVVKGTKISVEWVIDLLAAGWTHAKILENHPHLTQDDILACLSYASEILHSERVFPLEQLRCRWQQCQRHFAGCRFSVVVWMPLTRRGRRFRRFAGQGFRFLCPRTGLFLIQPSTQKAL